MKKEFGEYYLGLDIGTDSIGWAVTDLDYVVPKLNGKSLWGVRLFDAAETAQARRTFRSTRRRYKRRKKRIKLLQEIFAEEICKVDPGFYHRMQESNLYPEDKESNQPYALFSDSEFTDRDYHRKYPTIHHLISAIIERPNEKFDIRLIYLAVHHIIKYRGHFLFEGQDIRTVPSFDEVFRQFVLLAESEVDWQIQCDPVAVENILRDKDKKVRARQTALNRVLGADTKQKKAIVSLLAGGTARLSDVFPGEVSEDVECNSISFAKGTFEDNRSQIEDILNDKMVLVDMLKAIYDWALLEDLLSKADADKRYLASAKVNIYEEHRRDLSDLKYVIRTYYGQDDYNKVFRDSNVKDNYCAYVGLNKMGNRKRVVQSRPTQDDFCRFLRSIVDEPKEGEPRFNAYKEDKAYQRVVKKIQDGTLLPKQVEYRNSIIPYQLRHYELERILENASRHYPFLNEKDSRGLTPVDKIKMLHTFRIPYYVGPINDAHRNTEKDYDVCWVVKKSPTPPGPVTPWNFEEMIDLEKTAEAFIRTRTNKCTYLIGEDVLPKASLLYSKYMVLNELNNLRINGEPISVDLKQKIYNNLFKRYKTVTGKRLRDYLLAEGEIERTDLISGIDTDFRSSLSSYLDFKRVFGESIDEPQVQDMVEDLILWILLYGEDKGLLRNKISQEYGGQLSEEQMRTILGLKYAQWGRLSKTFLTELCCTVDGNEPQSILSAMWNTNNNLMELLSTRFGYSKKIDEFNGGKQVIEKLSYEVVDDLYVSPPVKRMLWQTLTIVDEIKKIMGREPKKVFIEMTRGKEDRPIRKESRKDALMALYQTCRDEERDLYNEICERAEADFRSDRLYLYFTQLGRCMYTGERIRLNDLYSRTYDIDHIFPRSRVKDDSIENRVLVTAEANRAKGDNYPLSPSIQAKQRGFWKTLRDKNLIGALKYERLTRTTPFDDKELGDFIARQIVETGQATKATADVLKRLLPNTEIVYVKARNVSDFRQKFGIVKVREANDYHHAHDAYLNIVVGNVYHTKFTSDPWNFIKQRADNRSYNMYKLFENNVKRGEICAWIADGNKSITQVKKSLSNNNIQFTRYAYSKKGQLFDQNPLRKGKGQFPIKQNSKRSDISKYGGYGSVSGSYFMLVEHRKGRKRVRSLEHVPVYLVNQITDKNEHDLISRYCKEILGLIEFEVLVPKVKVDSLIKVDGFFMHLRGRTGDSLIVRGANQLLIDDRYMRYLKKIVNFNNRKRENRKATVSEFDGITLEENLELYDLFIDKHENALYRHRPNPQIELLKDGRNAFAILSLEDQCYVIGQVLRLFWCGYPTAGDLSLIGGRPNSGKITISKNISNYSEFKLIHQSPTGVFAQEVDLLRI